MRQKVLAYIAVAALLGGTHAAAQNAADGPRPAAATAAPLAAPSGAPAGAGTIVRLDPRFDALVPRDAQIEKLADGFVFLEGPAWVESRVAAALFRFARQRDLSSGRKPAA